jgi:hypothetical protein
LRFYDGVGVGVGVLKIDESGSESEVLKIDESESESEVLKIDESESESESELLCTDPTALVNRC